MGSQLFFFSLSLPALSTYIQLSRAENVSHSLFEPELFTMATPSLLGPLSMSIIEITTTNFIQRRKKQGIRYVFPESTMCCEDFFFSF